MELYVGNEQTIQSLETGTVCSLILISPIQIPESWIQIGMTDCMVEFLSPDFPHNLANIFLPDLKVG
jgi:hypothetical protein